MCGGAQDRKLAMTRSIKIIRTTRFGFGVAAPIGTSRPPRQPVTRAELSVLFAHDLGYQIAD